VQRMGFLEHARPVATGINGLLKRARGEELRIVIEGVHVVPSLLEETFREAPNVMLAVVNVPDEEEHLQRFQDRSHRQLLRKSAAEYIKHFPAIREIHDFIADDACRHGFPVIDSREPERAAGVIIERLWRRILAADPG
jgi:2-phosphoglycerate kinase